ncbi:MAG: hypothetical protein EON90_09930 [Brevundimonas sp.]|nr:MAG: hypothetical protein EON90_09930 [Brevundimonas sp.]
MRTIAQIDAELARLKAEKRALKPVISLGPGFKRGRTYKPEAKGQRDPRVIDPAFLSWLHVDTACIACLIEGKPANPHGLQSTIEAAHQNLAIAGKGWRERGGGKRIHDARCVPLCTLHHTGLPNACDNGQRKFWDRLGLGDEIADYCADLFAAFKADAPAMPVIQHWAAAGGKAHQ